MATLTKEQIDKLKNLRFITEVIPSEDIVAYLDSTDSTDSTDSSVE